MHTRSKKRDTQREAYEAKKQKLSKREKAKFAKEEKARLTEEFTKVYNCRFGDLRQEDGAIPRMSTK